MKKTLLLKVFVVLGLGILMLFPACTSASSSTSVPATSSPTTTTPLTTPTTTTTTSTAAYTINVSTSSTLGQYLVDGKGMTLYWTTADSPGKSNVPANLLSVWPVFYVSSIVVAPSLSASDFGSITRSDGTPQTTYKNWPLYYYASDTAPGQTGGQGIAGRWSVVNPGASGPQPVPTSTTSTTSTTSSATTPSTTSSTSTSTSSSTTTITSSTSTAATTYQTLATAGQSTYSKTCAICHGANGGGTDICPVVMWGSGSTLGSYNGATLFTDVQGMLNYMSARMPLTAPGSLSSQQYTELLAYILIQANKVSPSTTFDESKLSSISIP